MPSEYTESQRRERTAWDFVETHLGGLNAKRAYQNGGFDVAERLTAISEAPVDRLKDALTLIGRLYGNSGFDSW